MMLASPDHGSYKWVIMNVKFESDEGESCIELSLVWNAAYYFEL